MIIKRDLRLIQYILLIMKQEIRELSVNNYTRLISQKLNSSSSMKNKKKGWNQKNIKAHIEYLVRPFDEHNIDINEGKSRLLLVRQGYLPETFSMGYLIRGLTYEGKKYINIMQKHYEDLILLINKKDIYMSMHEIVNMVINYDKKIKVEEEVE